MAIDFTVIYNQALALVMNVWSWILSFVPFFKAPAPAPPGVHRCVEISGPGGLDRLRVLPLNGRLTCGYNIPGFKSPYTSAGIEKNLPADCVIMCNEVHKLSMFNCLSPFARQFPS